MFFYEPNHEASNLRFKVSSGLYFAYPLHFHRHLEMHYTKSGYTDIEISGKWYHQAEGSVSMIFPYQLHQTGQAIGNSIHITSLINLDCLDKYSDTLLTMLPENPVITPDMLSDGFRERIIYTHKQYISSKPFHLEICESMLSAIVGEILSTMTLHELPKNNSNKNDKNSLARIMEYCTEHATQNISLESVSNALFLNKHYISHIFSDKIGVPFNTFINSHRIFKVCDLLKSTDMDILDIAYECGFHNQGTFNKVFKQHIGMSPSEYRNSSGQ